MMKEFQAENDRRQTITENNPTSLLNAGSNDIILQPTSNDSPSTPTKQFHLDHQGKTTSNQTKMNTPERRSNFDRNKLNIKTNKFTTDASKVSIIVLID